MWLYLRLLPESQARAASCSSPSLFISPAAVYKWETKPSSDPTLKRWSGKPKQDSTLVSHILYESMRGVSSVPQ